MEGDFEDRRSHPHRSPARAVPRTSKTAPLPPLPPDVRRPSSPLAHSGPSTHITLHDALFYTFQLIALIIALVFGAWAIKSYNAALAANDLASASNQLSTASYNASNNANAEAGKQALVANQLSLVSLCLTGNVSAAPYPWDCASGYSRRANWSPPVEPVLGCPSLQRHLTSSAADSSRLFRLDTSTLPITWHGLQYGAINNHHNRHHFRRH